MRKHRFLGFLLSVAFGLSVIFYASTQLTASTGQAGQGICPACPDSDQQCCPFYRGGNVSENGSSCPFIQKYGKICPGLNGTASAGECPVLRQQREAARKTAGSGYRIYMLRYGAGNPVLIPQHHQAHSAYFLILMPAPSRPDQGKSYHEVRI